MTEAEANKLLAANDEETLIEKILTKYLAYCESRDFVLVSRPAIGGSAGRLQLSSGITRCGNQISGAPRHRCDSTRRRGGSRRNLTHWLISTQV